MTGLPQRRWTPVAVSLPMSQHARCRWTRPCTRRLHREECPLGKPTNYKYCLLRCKDNFLRYRKNFVLQTRRHGGLFFHISPVTQSHLPKTLARTVSVCNEDKATNSVALFAELSSMVSHRRPCFQNSKARGVDGRGLRLRKHHIAMFDTGHAAEHLGRNRLKVTFESWPCVKRVSRVGEVDATSNESQPCEFAAA